MATTMTSTWLPAAGSLVWPGRACPAHVMVYTSGPRYRGTHCLLCGETSYEVW